MPGGEANHFGARLAEPSGRRLAAIAFADVVGYTTLVAADEAGTYARWMALLDEVIRPQAARHHGVIVQVMGDGVLAEFPSALDAVEWARSVQREALAPAADPTAAAPPIALRIGIHVGDVVDSAGGLFGDGVNIAARLQSHASPGGVVLSAAVRDLLRGALQVAMRDLGPLSLRHVEQPVRAYEIAPEIPASGVPAAADAPFVVALPRPPLPGRGRLRAAEGSPREGAAGILSPPEAEIGGWPGRRGAAGEAPRVRRQSRPERVAAAVLVVVLLAAGIGWWTHISPSAPGGGTAPAAVLPAAVPAAAVPAAAVPAVAPVAATAPRMSLVVLPFANLDGNPEQDYLADGVTEDLTITLGRFPMWRVTGGSTAAAYKGRAVDLRQVGRELGVRYALAGGVRRSGEHFSVNAQLVDAATGAQLWGDLFDVPRAGLAEFRRMVTGRVQGPLRYALVAAESRRSLAERPDQPDAVDLVLRGTDLSNRPGSPEGYIEARRLFERAIALDEGNADAHAGLGEVLVGNVSRGRTVNREADLEGADRHLARALSLNPHHVWAHFRRGIALGLRWRFDEALLQMDIVLAENSSFAPALGRRGYLKMITGRPEEAIADIEDAMRLSPRDPGRDYFFHHLGFASVMLHRDEDAVRYFRRAAAERTTADVPDLGASQLHLVATLALAGRTEESRALFREIQPTLTICQTVACLAQRYMRWSPHPSYRAMRHRLLDGLRIAGMPEE